MSATCRSSSWQLEWILPALFGFLTYISIRQHSWNPPATVPAMTANIAGAASGLLLMSALQARRLTILPSVAQLLFLLALSALISTMQSGLPLTAFTRLWLYAATATLALASYLLHRDADRIPLASYCLVISLVHLPFLAELVFWMNDHSGPYFRTGLTVPNFSNVRQFAEFGFFAAVAGTSLVVLKRSLESSAFVLTCCALFGLVATGSRGALLAWLVFVILLCFLHARRWRILAHAGIALALTIAGVWMLHTSGMLETPNLLIRVQAAAAHGSVDSGRLEIWQGSIEQILKHPFFGAGPEGYRVSGCCTQSVRQPHNFILQLLIEFGVVGVSLLALLCWRALKALGGFRALLRLVRANAHSTLLACLLAAYLAYSLIDGTMFHALPLMLVAPLSGVFAASLVQERTVDSPQ